jgi:hypothetical protein
VCPAAISMLTAPGDPRTFLGVALTGGGHERRFLPIDNDGVVHSVRSLEAGDLAVGQQCRPTLFTNDRRVMEALARLRELPCRRGTFTAKATPERSAMEATTLITR